MPPAKYVANLDSASIKEDKHPRVFVPVADAVARDPARDQN